MSEPNEWEEFKANIIEYQATHFLAQKFKEDTSKADLIDAYTRMYEFHQGMADRYKMMLEDVAKSITENLGKPKVTYSDKMA